MKKLIIGLLVLMMVTFSSSAQPQQSPVFTQQIVQNGIVYARVVNNSPYTVGCSLQDQHSFHTFYVYPGSVGMWYRIYGQYSWYCE